MDIANNIEKSKIKNSEVNLNTYNINIFNSGDLLKLPKEVIHKLKEMYPDEFNDNEEIEKIYKEAEEIINTEDSSLYISKKNIEKLKSLYQKLEFFENYYKTNTSSNNAKKYYYNLFVVLVQINLPEAIKKFETFPQEIKGSTEMQYLYSSFLMLMNDKAKIEEAEKILENLYFIKKYDIAFESLVRCYFLNKKYDKVIEVLTKAKKEKFDDYGFLSAIFVISKNCKKQFKEQELLKFNNQKFKDMPLFYTAKAQVLYKINPNSPKVKEQFKKGLKLLTEKDVLAISTMCDVAKSIGLKDEMIKFLRNINLTPYLKVLLIELLIYKPNLNEKEIEQLKVLKEQFDKQDIDIDYIDGVLLENKGQEIKAIKKYEESYNKNETIHSAYKYIQLSGKNFIDINDEILNKLSLNNDINSIVIVANCYEYKQDYEKAIKNLYKALYLLYNVDNRYIYKEYCECMRLGKFAEFKETTYVGKDVGVTLMSKTNSDKKYVVIEDDEFYKENKNILNVEIIRSTSDFGLELINKKLGDKIEYNSKTYEITKIKDKYTFFYDICFEKIKDIDNIEGLTAKENNVNEVIKKIEQKMIEIHENIEKQLDEYEQKGYIPLSAFCGTQKNVEKYYEAICTLLIENNRVFYAGIPLEIDVEKGFVIDLSSIIILALFEKLDVFTPELCTKIYITTSLKNKIKYYYESLLKKQGQKEMTIGIYKQEDGSQKLAKNEIEINQIINFWTDIYKCINRFKVEDVEEVKDDLWNENTREIFDKVQFDLIELAKQKKLPYICDDLAIRKFAYSKYKIEHSNCIPLIEYLHKDSYDKYIDTIAKLVNYNYIYAIYNGKYIGNIFVYLYKHYCDEVKQKVEKIIKELLKTKKNFDLNIEIVINMINSLKSIQYTIVLDKAYADEKITCIINMLINNIQKACNNLNLDYKEYEKFITKESGGIELKFDNDKK